MKAALPSLYFNEFDLGSVSAAPITHRHSTSNKQNRMLQ